MGAVVVLPDYGVIRLDGSFDWWTTDLNKLIERALFMKLAEGDKLMS